MAGFVSEERLTYGPWQAIERMIARLLQHAGFKDVSVVGGSGDHGADIIGVFKRERWVIQSKYRMSGGVDSTGAKEVVRAMHAYEATKIAVATNQTFTHDAYDYVKEAENNGIKILLWNGAYLLNYYKSLPIRSKAYRELRSYQGIAVDKVEANRSNGSNKALIIMATGLGKSIVATQLILNELERNPDQEVLVLAHMKELVRQLEMTSWSQLDKHYSTHLWTDGESPTYQGGVVFATWQSVLSAIKHDDSFSGRFGLVIVDEAHHAPSHIYRNLLKDLKPNYLVGLTATPWRGDEVSLEEIFGEPTFVMDIVDGMQKGFLAEVDYRMLTDGINWDEIARKSREGLTIRDLNTLLIMPDRDMAMVKLLADEMTKLETKRVLAFCSSIEHAERLRPLLSQSGIRVATIHSQLSREEIFKNLSSFRNGDIDMLLSIEMLNEGIDVPDVNLVAFMRVTHSRRIFVQQLGRGLRITPNKKKVIVLDFVADIRRVAAAKYLNNEATERGKRREVIRFQDGKIVQFDNDKTGDFFDQYLADVADIENYTDGATLKFPDSIQ